VAEVAVTARRGGGRISRGAGGGAGKGRRPAGEVQEQEPAWGNDGTETVAEKTQGVLAAVL
jgi:hypothetical protein